MDINRRNWLSASIVENWMIQSDMPVNVGVELVISMNDGVLAVISVHDGVIYMLSVCIKS